MEHAEYVFTFGMTDDELDELLRSGDVGVLALADEGDAYAVPVAYDYDGTSLVLRLVDFEGSEKMQYLEATGTATFVVHGGDPPWSIVVQGHLRERVGYDETRINEEFPPVRLFDEEIDETEEVVYELEMEEVTGRQEE